MPIAEVDDLKMYYLEKGAGPPLVMVMGWGGSSDWWPASFTDHLARHFRLIMFDNRGVGRTRGEARRFSIPAAARETAGLMSILNIPRAHIFGISMGGMIAQELALAFPEKVDRMVIAASFSGAISNFWRMLRLEHGRILWRLMTRKEARRKPLVVHFLFTREVLNQRPDVLRQFKVAAAKAAASRQVLWAQFRAMFRFNVTARLKQLAMPTLVICGTRDAMMPPACSRGLARRLPQGQLLLLKGRGHAFPAEAPLQTSREIIGFLTRHALSPQHSFRVLPCPWEETQ